MNMGVGDAYDIGWKLAAVLKGYGGEHLLQSYTMERRPVALRNVERSGVHFSVHSTYSQWAGQMDSGVILSNAEEAKAFKKKLSDYVISHDGENKDHGIEMGYSFPNSPVIITDDVENGGEMEPTGNPRHYTTTTRPGSRAPHVFLSNSETSIFDLFGSDYTIVDFSSNGAISKSFESVATSLQVPLKRVHLPHESHVRSIWQRDVILVRPDHFVSWRSADPPQHDLSCTDVIKDIILIAVGQKLAVPLNGTDDKLMEKSRPEIGQFRAEKPLFTASIGNVQQDSGTIEKMGAFQV